MINYLVLFILIFGNSLPASEIKVKKVESKGVVKEEIYWSTPTGDLTYLDKQKAEVLIIKVRLAIKNKQFKTAYGHMREIISFVLPTEQILKSWTKVLKKEGLHNEAAYIYSKIITLKSYRYDTKLSNTKGLKKDKSLIDTYRQTAELYYANFLRGELSQDEKNLARDKAIELYEKLYTLDKNYPKSFLNLVKLYNNNLNFFHSIRLLREILVIDAFKNDEALRTEAEFEKNMAFLLASSPYLSLDKFTRFLEVEKKLDPLWAKTSKKVIDALTKKQFYGYFSLRRGIGTNLDALPEGTHQEDPDLFSGGQNTQIGAGVNVFNQQLSFLPITFNNYHANATVIAFYTRQDLPKFQNFSNLFWTATADIFDIKQQYNKLRYGVSYARLLLNREVSSNEYSLKNFSETLTFNPYINIETKIGPSRLSFPIAYTNRFGSTDQDSYSYALSYNQDIWQFNKYSSLEFFVVRTVENQHKIDAKEKIFEFGVSNEINLPSVRLTPSIAFESTGYTNTTQSKKSMLFSFDIRYPKIIYGQKITFLVNSDYEKINFKKPKDQIKKKSLVFGMSTLF